MKKVFILFLLIASVTWVAGCKKEDNHDKVFKEVSIGLQGDDKTDSVTKDITLPVESTVANAKLEWSSSHPSIISTSGKVNQPNEDTTVTLILKVTIDGSTQEKSFFITVLAKTKDPNPNGEDPNEKEPGGNNEGVPAGYIGISSVEDFKAITNLSAKYILTADIDFAGAEVAPLGRWGAVNWEGVLLPGELFTGVFDGNGYALKNFKITASNYPGLKEGTEYFGASLFPNLTGTVENLNIINAQITGDGFSGGVAGLVERGGVIRNVYFEGTVTSSKSWGSPESMDIPAGGIAGMIGGGTTVENVLIDAKIVGGHTFFGYAFSGGTNVSNLYAVYETLALESEADLILTGQEKGEETQYLLTTLSSSKAVPKSELSTLTLSTKWSKNDALRPYLIRKDEIVPEWAKK